MISDRLYQHAFEYRKTKLWKILPHTDLFAVRSSDGQLCYISLTGGSDEPITLAAYIGDDGLDSFLRLSRTDFTSLSLFGSEELLMQQHCLQCMFVGKDELSAEEHEEVKGYTRRHGMRIGGKKAYPLFRKYTPNHLPWPLQTEQEQAILCSALAAALALFDLLKGKKPKDLGFGLCLPEPGAFPQETPPTIPLLEYREDGYVLEQIPLPPERPTVIPAPRAANDIGIASLKKLKKTGIWECKIIRFPQPVQDSPDQIPFFPVALLAVESSTGYILQVPPVENYEDDPEHLMDLFIEALLNEKIRPIKIRVPDERTYAFARPLCERLKITLSPDEETPALDAAEEDFFIHFDLEIEDQLEELRKIFDTLLDLDEVQLEELRNDVGGLFDMLERQGLLGPGEKLVALDTPAHSYVISVSLDPGCSRHIQIAGDATLLELHSAILDAFDFMDDHAHAFFMDDIPWSKRDCYYMAGLDASYRTTKGYTLDQAGLHKGMKFKYLFDVGEEWTFQCRVLKDLKKYTAQPLVIKETGEAPDQY